jgi:hypothetical protein
MLKIILTSLFAVTASIANAQTTEQQLQTNYKIVCASDAELTVDQELLSIIGDNQGAAQARQDFQTFVANPTFAIHNIVTPYNELIASIKADILSASAAELQAEAEKYVQANGGTIDEAKEIIIANVTQSMLQQQQIPPLEVLVYQTAAGVCSTLTFIQPEIAKSGCKTASGEAIDMTAATQFCTSIAPQLALINDASSQLNSIQQQAQALIDAVTASIQRDAQAQMAPLYEAVNLPFEAVVKAALDLTQAEPLIAPAVGSEVETPVAPAQP